MAVGWLVGGWGLVGVPVPSVQFNRSILSVNIVGPSSRSRRAFQEGIGGGRSRLAFKAGGGRSWALTRGQFCDCTIHETAKTIPNTQNSRSSSTKTPILCSKRPKTGVPKPKKAQKPRFCAQNARKWGFRRAKAHKNLDFVLKTPENGGSSSNLVLK